MQEHLIKVLPSGHEFRALEEETLLDAALRSGLNIDYSCSSGSCGDCHARLVEGQLGREENHDYNFSARQKAQGMFLLCTAHAAGDLVIEAGEAKSAADIPHQRIRTKVGKVEAGGELLRILQLKTPRTTPLRFLAGQHVELTLPGVGSLDSSIASCPCNGSQLQFHIPYDRGLPFVRQVFDGLRHGSEVVVDGPFGEMTLDDDSQRPLLMVAQDHELAPVKSLIEHAINLDVAQPVRLFWLVGEVGHYLENHCRSWGEALDDYRFLPLSYDAGQGEAQQVAQLLASIAVEIPQLQAWDIYCAGSSAFNEVLHQGLIAAGADPQRLFYPTRRHLSRMEAEALSG